jgi:hypothetical protein
LYLITNCKATESGTATEIGHAHGHGHEDHWTFTCKTFKIAFSDNGESEGTTSTRLRRDASLDRMP